MFYLLVYDESIDEYYLDGIFEDLSDISQDDLLYCSYKVITGNVIKSETLPGTVSKIVFSKSSSN